MDMPIGKALIAVEADDQKYIGGDCPGCLFRKKWHCREHAE